MGRPALFVMLRGLTVASDLAVANAIEDPKYDIADDYLACRQDHYRQKPSS